MNLQDTEPAEDDSHPGVATTPEELNPATSKEQPRHKVAAGQGQELLEDLARFCLHHQEATNQDKKPELQLKKNPGPTYSNK